MVKPTRFYLFCMEKKKLLHIANGDDIYNRLEALNIPGEVVVWREMLCEGPTLQELGSPEFIDQRKKFLEKEYQISPLEYEDKFLSELRRLDEIDEYEEIILWFEFDLFSHMNMMAAIFYMMQVKKKVPLYLVCSGKIKGEQELMPLADLSRKQFKDHYDHKIKLDQEDLEMASLIWEIYCSKDPLRVTSEIKKTTNFRYLSSCLRAHIERFPSSKSGLNSLETNVLKLIKEHDIKSLQQLLGYSLRYQGYYGYVDIQMQRVIDKVTPFYSITETGIELNDSGEKALAGSFNFYQQLKEPEYFGGVEKYNFLYDPESHNLLKL